MAINQILYDSSRYYDILYQFVGEWFLFSTPGTNHI